MMRKTAAIILLLLTCLGAAAQKQNGGTIHGMVTAKSSRGYDRPAYGAIARILFTENDKPDSLFQLVDFNGKFRFSGLKTDKVKLTVSFLGFKTHSAEYELGDGSTVIYAGHSTRPPM